MTTFSDPDRVLVVVDADAVLSSVDNECRTGWKSRLAQLASGSETRVFASAHVDGEVRRRLAKFVSADVSASQLFDCYERRFATKVTWVEVCTGGPLDGRIAEVTDPTDVPTAILATLLAPCLVFAEDKSLRRPGFAPEGWRDVAGSAVDSAEAGTAIQAIGLLVASPGLVLAGSAKLTARKLGVSPWLTALGFLVVMSALLHHPDRRRAAAQRLRAPAAALAREFAQQATRSQQSDRALGQHIVRPHGEPTLTQRIARVVAEAPEPLLATEIRQRLALGSGSRVRVEDVRHILVTGPEFVEVSASRFQVGRSYGQQRDGR